MNYFEFYDIPVKFNIDENALKAKFYKIAKENHPDFFVNDEEKYNTVLQISSLNNEVYKCLSNFYLRAEYILKISAIKFEEKLTPKFLFEMMEINESLEDLKVNYNDKKAIDITNEIEQISIELQNELLQFTKSADMNETAEEVLFKKIKENLQKHKYILRLKETLANIAAR